MPAFRPPEMTYSKNKAWNQRAKPGFRNPNVLWNDYWQRFNTVTIPLLDEDAYFADAMAAAKYAENREHLEELLAEKHEERRQDLERAIHNIGLSSVCLQQQYPSTATRDAALKLGQTGSLDSFVQFVCGVIFGWNSDNKQERLTYDDFADDDDDIDNEAAIRDDYDVEDDVSNVGGDPWEHENTFPSEVYSSPDLGARPNDDWEDSLRKVTECYDEVETSGERRVQSPPSKRAHDTALITEGGGENGEEEGTTKSHFEPPHVRPQSTRTHSPSPQSCSPSPRPTENISADPTTPPSTDSLSKTNPYLSHATSLYTSQSSLGASNVKTVDKPNPPANVDSTTERESGKRPDGPVQDNGVATDTASTRKRSFLSNTDEENDEGYQRRKRRVINVEQSLKSPSPRASPRIRYRSRRG